MNLEEYDAKYQTHLGETIKDFLSEWKAPEGEQRLSLVAEHFSKLSLEQAYRLLDPESYRREIEEIQAYKKRSQFFQFGRAVLALAPLILTWASVSWAVLSYSSYIKTSQGDKSLPFLQLWQNGSLGGFTFFWTGILDVILLVLFLGFSIYSLRLDYYARSRSEIFAQKLKNVTEGLMQAVAKEGRNDVASEPEIERIVRYIKEAIAESYQDIEELVSNTKDIIVMTGQTIENTFDKQIKPIINNLDSSVSTLRINLNTISESIKGLNNASKRIAITMDVMERSATQMASSAMETAGNTKNLATNVATQTQISENIAANLVHLDMTQERMIGIITETQKDLVIEVRGTAQDMKASAEKLQEVAKEVEVVGQIITSGDVQQISNGAEILANTIKQAAIELQKTARELQEAQRRSRRWPF